MSLNGWCYSHDTVNSVRVWTANLEKEREELNRMISGEEAPPGIGCYHGAYLMSGKSLEEIMTFLKPEEV